MRCCGRKAGPRGPKQIPNTEKQEILRTEDREETGGRERERGRGNKKNVHTRKIRKIKENCWEKKHRHMKKLKAGE